MIDDRVRRLLRPVAIALLAFALASCDKPGRSLADVPLPDTSSFEPSVRGRLAAVRGQFDRVAAGHPSDAELGGAYGELAMNYHAQGVTRSAEVAYANARDLLPNDKRWAYLLGHLYAETGRPREAIAAFEAALAIDADDAPAQIRVGKLYLEQGNFDTARKVFEQARAKPVARAAALTGLGKVALAEGRYREAADRLEDALAIVPAAARLRQPLAVAYRGLGETAKAEETLKRYSAEGLEPGLPDPIFDEIGARVAASRVLLARGYRAGKVGRLDLAEHAFRTAVNDDPNNSEAVTNLGVTLANMGRLDEAQRWLAEGVRLDDRSGPAHFSLALLLDRKGQDEDAMREYAASIERDPANVSARVYLADAKMRSGHADDAARLYGDALVKSPDSPRVRFSLAMALVKAGRFDEARAVLEAGLAKEPSDPDLMNALARVLATAPQDAARNGRRALQIAKSLVDSRPVAVTHETYAMALAETKRFEKAIEHQRQAIASSGASVASQPATSFREHNLELYRQKKPAREAWPADDPIFKPRSPAARLASGTPPKS